MSSGQYSLDNGRYMASVEQYLEPDITVSHDTTAEGLRDTGLDDVEALTTDEGEEYIEAYLEEAVETVGELLSEIGPDVDTPDAAYRPELADRDGPVPLLKYDPGDDAIVFIRTPDEESDRPYDPSLLGVLAHEIWHSHFERTLRQRYGFIGRERADVPEPGSSLQEGVYDTIAGAGDDARHYMSGSMPLDSMYDTGYLRETGSTRLDPLTGTEIDVREDVPDVSLAGLDEAFAHIITLTFDGHIHDDEMQEEYWEHVRQTYNEQAEENGLYDDRTGEFGDEIALFGEHLIEMFMVAEEDLTMLGRLLEANEELIEQGLLNVRPEEL